MSEKGQLRLSSVFHIREHTCACATPNTCMHTKRLENKTVFPVLSPNLLKNISSHTKLLHVEYRFAKFTQILMLYHKNKFVAQLISSKT